MIRVKFKPYPDYVIPGVERLSFVATLPVLPSSGTAVVLRDFAGENYEELFDKNDTWEVSNLILRNEEGGAYYEIYLKHSQKKQKSISVPQFPPDRLN